MQHLTRLVYRDVNYRLLFPFEGRVEVVVKKGESVRPGDTLFKSNSKKVVSSLYVPSELGVKVEACEDYIVRLNGEYITKGEVLAEKLSSGGLTLKRMYATGDGILSLDRLSKGFVDILSESQTQEYSIQAYGKVLDIDLTAGMSLQTMVWRMPLLTDNYHEKPNEYKNVRVGKFEVVGDGSSVYVTKDLKDDYRGSIVYAGRFVSVEILREIYARGAEYVIAYSMDYLDFAPLNFSVGIVGGFGNIPYPKEYISIFKAMNGSFASIDLEKNHIVWPDQGKYIGKNPNEASSNLIDSFKVGMYVRVVDVDNYRSVGRVLDINSDDILATVELEDGKRVLLPRDVLVPLFV